MNKIDLSPNFSVSEQITPDDVTSLKALNVDIIVCNRPDGEAPDQPPFSVIAESAQLSGIEIVNIPFSAGTMTENDVQALLTLMQTGKKIHAYCRTGNRSSNLWQAANQLLSQSL